MHSVVPLLHQRSETQFGASFCTTGRTRRARDDTIPRAHHGHAACSVYSSMGASLSISRSLISIHGVRTCGVHWWGARARAGIKHANSSWSVNTRTKAISSASSDIIMCCNDLRGAGARVCVLSLHSLCGKTRERERINARAAERAKCFSASSRSERKGVNYKVLRSAK